MPNGDPGKVVIPQVKIVAMFNLIRSEDVGLTWLKIVGKWISKIVNLKIKAWSMRSCVPAKGDPNGVLLCYLSVIRVMVNMCAAIGQQL